MKIEGLFERQDLTLTVVKDEINKEFPGVGLTELELHTLAQVRLLRKAG